MNLVSNAAEAMPEGGKILISTESPYVDRPIKGYDNVQEGEYVTLTVSDTGAGIRKEDLQNVFDPYFTTKQSGTGLGLAIVHNIIESHKGDIKVESEMGKGTSVIITLPHVKTN